MGSIESHEWYYFIDVLILMLYLEVVYIIGKVESGNLNVYHNGKVHKMTWKTKQHDLALIKGIGIKLSKNSWSLV